MIEVKKIYKRNIKSLLDDAGFWNHPFLAISKHRLLAHSKNPNSSDDDIVLLLAYIDNELLGYMGVFIDKIIIDGIEKKIGWLSTWWVHPKTKGTGIGRKILDTMYAENEGQIGISQFTPSAKRVYDKSGYFTTLKNNTGVKAVLRSNLTFVIPVLIPKSKALNLLFQITDSFFNFFINFKLAVQRRFIKKGLKNIKIEYLNSIDSETETFINTFNKKDISHKTTAFFEWLKAYNWVQEAPLIELTDKNKYEFSMYDKEFNISYIKIKEKGTLIGFIVLQKRNYVVKVLFSYFENRHTKVISDVIKLQSITQNTREIICYEEAICANFKKSSIFLYKTKKTKQSIISKVFNKSDFDNTRMNFGDGDCCFA
ncbi:hypothetical protein FNO01nite_03310 [Flavobacterium noncentrifugens]|uniref:Acetyltransferase (GNAT) domain-containing protein n=1 Tax=Flavobacterium noncentrifugens TaxID=1128970 RepID=A0A1G8S145_9FLAO|nr:GNAT family N-acetyltransferase [Flavobacterium noncentrifugens]GEP49659.1 hypothetical protein FNO01nite_03310 [Flavobacterium noncentrifugens]SDJ22926.1 Acetyltransferase (GNAT) domain-containing protein [Flavobacterium noncentrifugens]